MKKAQAESAALLAKLEAETLALLASEETSENAGKGIEYIPDGGGEKRKTRSGRALLDLD